MQMAIITMFLALVMGMAIIGGLGYFFYVIRKSNRGDYKPRIVEHEMTVSEFNDLLDEHEAAAKAPLEERISELEDLLDEREQEVQALKTRRENTT